MSSRRDFFKTLGIGASVLGLPGVASAWGLRRHRGKPSCCPPAESLRQATDRVACTCACPNSLYALINGIYYWHCFCKDGNCTTEVDVATPVMMNAVDCRTHDCGTTGGCIAINSQFGFYDAAGQRAGSANACCGSLVSGKDGTTRSLTALPIISDFYLEKNFVETGGVPAFIAPFDPSVIQLKGTSLGGSTLAVGKSSDLVRKYKKPPHTDYRYVRLIELRMKFNGNVQVLQIGQEVSSSDVDADLVPEGTYLSKSPTHKFNHRVLSDVGSAAIYHVQLNKNKPDND